jgi:hypothetical protein
MDAGKASRRSKGRWMENRCGEGNQLHPASKNPTKLWLQAGSLEVLALIKKMYFCSCITGNV